MSTVHKTIDGVSACGFQLRLNETMETICGHSTVLQTVSNGTGGHLIMFAKYGNGSGIGRQRCGMGSVNVWEIISPDDPDHENGTKLFNSCIVIGPGHAVIMFFVSRSSAKHPGVSYITDFVGLQKYMSKGLRSFERVIQAPGLPHPIHRAGSELSDRSDDNNAANETYESRKLKREIKFTVESDEEKN
ncbi:hypothetical protein TNCV_3821171 [Trichonephila clavipes]|nr:hypothetical protein TNCV_3821171 [Trichonephila clavipes]